jgi:hypothetical protein
MPIKKIIRIRGPRIKMFHFLLLHHLYQFLHKRKADNTCRLRLSTALYGKLHAQSVKAIRTDVFSQPQVSNIATSILYSASFGSFFTQQGKVISRQVSIGWAHRQITLTYVNTRGCLIKLISVIAYIRSAIPWSIKNFGAEHTLRVVSIYLPKLFFA